MDYVSEWKERLPGQQPCCTDCFLCLVCLTASRVISPYVFRCNHCWEMNIFIVEGYERLSPGLKERGRTYRVPAVCPLCAGAVRDGVYAGSQCDACNTAIKEYVSKKFMNHGGSDAEP